VEQKNINKKAWRWLYGQLPELVENKILSNDNADALKEYYGEPEKKIDAANVMLVAFGILAALLIGGGVIMILAHNWDELPHIVRVIMAFLPLAVAQIAGVYILMKNRGPAWSESCAVMISCGVCAAISIVAQIYHISGDFPRFMLTWALLTLPLVYFMRSSATAFLYMAQCVVWLYAAKNEHRELWLFWPLLAAVVPHLLASLKADRTSQRSIWLLWGGMLAVTVSLGGIIDEYNLSRAWVVVYTLFFSLSCLVAEKFWTGKIYIRSNPLLIVGLPGVAIISFICSYGDFWKFRYYSYRDFTLPEIWYADALVMLLAVIVFITLLKQYWLYKRYRDLFQAGSVLVAFVCWEVHMFWDMNEAPAIAFNLYLLALGGMYIADGMKRRSMPLLNKGLLIVGVLTILRFFDGDFGLLTRGVAFILTGLILLVINIKVRKKWATNRTAGEVADV
jgi:uncharacterized membrane protein